MVLVAQRRPQAAQAAVRPQAAPSSASNCWADAQKQQAARLVLPLFSVRPGPWPPSQAALRLLAAALPLDASPGSEWAGSAAFVPLAGLGSAPAEALKKLVQPRSVERPPAAAPGAPPTFLLPRSRMPHTDAWLRQSSLALSVPCITSPAVPDAQEATSRVRRRISIARLWASSATAALPLFMQRPDRAPLPPLQQGGGMLGAIAADCAVEQEAPPRLPTPDKEVGAGCGLNAQQQHTGLLH